VNLRAPGRLLQVERPGGGSARSSGKKRVWRVGSRSRYAVRAHQVLNASVRPDAEALLEIRPGGWRVRPLRRR